MAAQIHGDLSASKRVGGNCRRHGAANVGGRGPKPHGSDRVSTGSCGALAGAGGIEPPNGGIKIRCLTTWLRPIRPSGTAEARATADSLDWCRSIGRDAAFQPPEGAKYHSPRRCRAIPYMTATPPRSRQASFYLLRTVETSPVSWEDG